MQGPVAMASGHARAIPIKSCQLTDGSIAIYLFTQAGERVKKGIRCAELTRLAFRQ